MTTIVHSAGLAHQFGKSATSAQAFEQINVQGTANVMRAAVAAGVSHVVLVSSVSVYGGGAEPTDETFPCHPKDAYGVSKWQAEQVARQIADASGMRLTILRMATIFGEQDPGNIGRLMHAIARGRFVWLGQGTNRKSLVYRGDAARACLLAAMSSSRSESGDERIRVYNVSASAVSVAQIVRGLATGLGRGTPHWYIPAPLVTTIGRGLSVCMAHRGPVARMNRTIAKWLSDDVYLADRFERDFQFRPRVSLDEGLGREAAWYRHSKAA
jgi:nucleoside-diphosphate-sugar epimerase